jgi:hypothetical protein
MATAAQPRAAICVHKAGALRVVEWLFDGNVTFWIGFDTALFRSLRFLLREAWRAD